MFLKLTWYVFTLLFFIINLDAEFCKKIIENCSKNNNNVCENWKSQISNKRYIFYDVNPLEGFNLRRDVYIRVANFVRHLLEDQKHYQWILVLPPWGNMNHWKSTNIGEQNKIPWSTFFDIKSLQNYIPILEMWEFIKEYPLCNGETVIDHTYFLRNDEDMFKTGKFENRNKIIDCPKTHLPFQKRDDGYYFGYFWGYTNITTKTIECIIFHGTILNLKVNLKPELYKTIMFDHMEITLHHSYGSVHYWRARRSMRYNSQLYKYANQFRLLYLNSNDENDKTKITNDWRSEKKHRNAIGGPYVAVHFRRQDFVVSHSATSPTIINSASQIRSLLKLLHLNTVFIATDSEEEEFLQLKNELNSYNVFRFLPRMYIKQKFKDGGIAIIDQIICSHARYFIGTYESTFTFRIQEDREILGFPANTTFNNLCIKEDKCLFSSKWKIVWD